MKLRITSRGIAALASLAAAATSLPALASCGSAFCSVNSDWTAAAVGASEGRSFDLRYERILQDQPRTGTRNLAVGQIPRHHDEVRTANRNLLATFSQNFGSGWGYSLALPLVDRDHEHVHNHHGAKLDERWSFREVGDARVLGRYQQAVGDGQAALGAIFGLKLPTGRRTVSNSEGDVAERSLQPGSGTTDAILGAYYRRQLPESDSSVFAQAQYQRPLSERDGFAPGAQLSLDLGYARRLTERVSGLLQLNAVAKGRDRGAQAEPADSGSRAVFLSPGVSWDATDSVRVYGFVQQPLRQRVNGVQLTARRALAVGVTTRF